MARKDLSGPVCKHCLLPIRRCTDHGEVLGGIWVHVDEENRHRNIYCSNNLTGLTARFAEPS